MPRPFPSRSGLQEIGRVRIGASELNARGKKVPQRLETFRLTSQDKAVIEAAAHLYGGEVQPWTNGGVKQWQVYTEANTLRVCVQGHGSISSYYEKWDEESCVFRCDGCVVIKSARLEEIGVACWCPADTDPATNLHKMVVRMPCTLPDVAPYGVWRIDSHGINAAAGFLGLAKLREAQGIPGHQAFHAMLRLEQRRSGKRLVRVPTLYPLHTDPPPTPVDAAQAIDALFGADERHVIRATAPAVDDEGDLTEEEIRVHRAAMLDRITEIFGEMGHDPAPFLAHLCEKAGCSTKDVPLALLAERLSALEARLQARA